LISESYKETKSICLTISSCRGYKWSRCRSDCWSK